MTECYKRIFSGLTRYKNRLLLPLFEFRPVRFVSENKRGEEKDKPKAPPL